MNWDLVISIVTALGIFEVIKRLLLFSVEESLIKRNIEIRQIAARALRCCEWLRMRNFEEPLNIEDTAKLSSDIHTISTFDKELGTQLMLLVNNPRLIKRIYSDNGEKSREQIKKLHTEVYDISDELIRKLNLLIYKPIIKIWKLSL